MPEEAITGGCLCGAIRYVARTRPTSSMICHCRSCRRAAGSPAVAWLTFAARALEIVRGTPHAFHSSPPVSGRAAQAPGRR